MWKINKKQQNRISKYTIPRGQNVSIRSNNRYNASFYKNPFYS